MMIHHCKITSHETPTISSKKYTFLLHKNIEKYIHPQLHYYWWSFSSIINLNDLAGYDFVSCFHFA